MYEYSEEDRVEWTEISGGIVQGTVLHPRTDSILCDVRRNACNQTNDMFVSIL